MTINVIIGATKTSMSELIAAVLRGAEGGAESRRKAARAHVPDVHAVAIQR